MADRTERIEGLQVTPELFDVVGVRPQAGSFFGAEAMRPGHNHVAVLTDDLWRTRFAGAADIVGRSIVLDGMSYTVAGVLPKRLPRIGKELIYLPMVAGPLETSRGTRTFGIMGRLRAGVDLTAAQRRMNEISTQLSTQYSDDAGNTARLQPVEEAFVQDAKTLLSILFGAVGLVLLIACANIANLLLARSTGRELEMAIRSAIGAGRWRLCRQLLVENMVLGVIGGCAAILPAMLATEFITSFHLDDLPNTDLVRLNPSVLLFNFGLALATGLLFGLVPAWQSWRAEVNTTLKAGGRAQMGGVHQRLRGWFVVSEVAFTTVLLAAAGLVFESFLKLRAENQGYNPQGVLTMRIVLSDAQYDTPEKQTGFFERVARQARELPGVRAVSCVDELPTSDDIHGAGLIFPDRPEPRTEDIPIVLQDAIMPDYFRAMQMPLLRGRVFGDGDRKGSRLVAVIDEWTARRYFPGQNPLGRQIKLGRKQPALEIVGVVATASQNVLVKLLKGQIGQVYLPLQQQPRSFMNLVIRTDGDPKALIGPMRKLVREIDIDQPIFRVATMEEALAAGRKTQQLAACLLGGLALAALLLAAIGLYGVTAYSVGQRTREFGLRLSLGAQPHEILGLVMRQGIRLAAVGLALGLAGALALTRALESLLYGIGASDPGTFVMVACLLGGVALAASYFPACRATQVDPVVALRSE
jgi:predicted permease